MGATRLVIAGRGSKLAVIQAQSVGEAVRRIHPGVELEFRTVTTTGDRDRRPFWAIGGKGLFTSEVEREIVEGRADIAVHSAKDLTGTIHSECRLICIPTREQAADVVVGGEGTGGEERLGRLPDGAVVGTSSMRRRALLAEARPELHVVDFRGNLDTRLRKVRDGEVSAAVLAAAGIERLGLTREVEPGILDPSWWVPAPGQGALAIEARADRDDLAELFAPLDDAAARAAVECERAFGAHLEGGCSIPLGCRAEARGESLVVTGYLGRPDGTHGIRDRVSGPARAAVTLGEELARAILAAGGEDILEDVRAETGP